MDTNLESRCLSAFSSGSRRRFLISGIATLMSASLLLADNMTALAQGGKQKKIGGELSAPDQIILLTKTTFFELRSEVFTVQLNGEEFYLQLIEVEASKQASISKSARHKMEDPSFKARMEEESFTLVFRTTAELPRRSGTFELKHHKLGEFEIFLTQVGKPVGPWRLYEAVFNRLQE